MKILVACESSGRVRDAFLKKGHDAVSCDLLPSESDFGNHIQDDVRNLKLSKYDLIIAHPPCTYLASSGLHWNKKFPERQKETELALDFIEFFFLAPVKMLAIENPVGCISSVYFKPSQIIQPYMFGDDASKKTCLWLRGLPLLKPTKMIIKERYANQTASGQNNLPPSKDRWKLRSTTYKGVANAMASQWGKL